MKYSLFVLLLFFVNPIDLRAQEKTKNYSFSLGTNPTRMLAGDYEGIAMFSTKSFSIGVSAGYDFNYFDYNSHHQDITESASNRASPTSQGSRYFWGEGIVWRIFADYNYTTNKKNHFVSIEYLYKERNYNDLAFADNMWIYSESADQVVTGFTFYKGRIVDLSKHFILKHYWGLGLRFLESNYNWDVPSVAQPGDRQAQYGTDYFWFPSIHYGVVVLFSL